MARADRRQFFRIGGLASGIAAGLPRFAFGDAIDDRADRTVRLSGDGLGLTPPQYAGLLNQLVEAAGHKTAGSLPDGGWQLLGDFRSRTTHKDLAATAEVGRLRIRDALALHVAPRSARVV